MQIFDFHLHPGYDFHGPALDHSAFTERLKQDGIVKCAGSYASRFCQKRLVSEYADLIPQYNRLAWEFHDQEPDFFVPGIHIPPDLVDLSLEELQKHHKKGGTLVGELVHYMMGWNYSHPGILPIFSYARELDMVVSIHPTADFATLERYADQEVLLDKQILHTGPAAEVLSGAEFRRTFHKPVTYAAWDWDATVFDALQQAGFASWEEQAEALKVQREKFAH